MRFRRRRHGTVEFGEQAVKHLLMNRQDDMRSAEAGGILLGRLIATTNDIVVDQAVGPVQQDQRRRFAFHRAREPAQTVVNEAWDGSDHTLNYLGEWHTHPEYNPAPSNVDISDWKRIATEAQFEQESLIFVIVGRLTTRVWEVYRFELALWPLAELNDAQST